LSEMLCMSLERMELSKGMRELERKAPRTQFSKLTLIPSKWIVTQIQHLKRSAQPVSPPKVSPSLKTPPKNEVKLPKKEKLGLSHTLDPQHVPILHRLFDYYCQYGDALNQTCIKSSMFLKLVKEAT